ncbi:phospholipase D family protein [Actinokineospora sp. PR83]|uniref:phospholipase D-like domain-containing protein DpdK n=1 Tax=Actinokineospora sp. PR83 TaxID=2884908 RepID=UPI001F3427D7|nr:phospholipase D-like domain-containing protein DpdK [Actinokineospora sp. PR83]MCG8917389.1 phospholipase D family protein [Actinokineospora sp. PR83]
MSALERTVRTGPRLGLSANAILADALLSELVSPGPELWVISAWISDVEVLDNTQGMFDALFGEENVSRYRLADILAKLARSGSKVWVATRPTPHNNLFINQLNSNLGPHPGLSVIFDPIEHEKTVCGNGWMISGSMNFTANGLGNNEESVRYVIDVAEVAQARLDFAARWGGPR